MTAPNGGVSGAPQFGPQLKVIVDLAIVGNHVSAAGRSHGLTACRRKIYDRQTSVAETDTGLRVRPNMMIVGSPMQQRSRHGVEKLATRLTATENARKSAH